MKPRSWVCWISSLLLCAGADAGTGAPTETPVDVTGTTRLTSALDYADYALAAPPPLSAPVKAATLPLDFPAADAERRDVHHWVRVPFRLSALPPGELGVYLPAVSPGVAVYVNGVLVGESEYFGVPEANSWYYPQFFSVPNALLHVGENELLAHMLAPSYDSYFLSVIWLGNPVTLRERANRLLLEQAVGIEFVSLVIGAIGLLTLTLWLRRRVDTVFGWFSLSCLVWMLRNAQFYFVNARSQFLLWLATDAALFWLVAVLYIVSFRILERRFPRIERALIAYAALATLAMFVAGPLHKQTVTVVAYLLLMPASAAFMFFLTREVLRRRTPMRILLWIAAVVTTASAAIDLCLMNDWLDLPLFYLMPYAALFYAATVGWTLVDRFIQMHNESLRMNVELENRVRQREAELSAQYAATAQIMRTQAVGEERARILHDMHDGLGLHLITARRMIESGKISHERIAGLLGDAMDELRIAIDSMKPSADDLLVMLGNLRYRLEPRLNLAGIELHWQLDGVEKLQGMRPAQITELTRIVQELCTNAIKHSRATDMYLTVAAIGSTEMRLTLTDNGVGFDTQQPSRGEGLRNIERRAARIGAIMELRSKAGETTFMFTVRVDADEKA